MTDNPVQQYYPLNADGLRAILERLNIEIAFNPRADRIEIREPAGDVNTPWCPFDETARDLVMERVRAFGQGIDTRTHRIVEWSLPAAKERRIINVAAHMSPPVIGEAAAVTQIMLDWLSDPTTAHPKPVNGWHVYASVDQALRACHAQGRGVLAAYEDAGRIDPQTRKLAGRALREAGFERHSMRLENGPRYVWRKRSV